ncbi:MAG: type II toxin-antitoxin system RelE family toxin [Sulfobacillus sp.]
MAPYRILFKSSVAKDLSGIPRPQVLAILERIQALAQDPRPRGCEKLSGLARYRLRQGSYRIIYEISDDEVVVLVVKVGHRSHVYR